MPEKTDETRVISIRSFVSNCYLVASAEGYFLVDTGIAFRRGHLKNALHKAGCHPGDLKLIIVTHADFDHTGNCAWLTKHYGARTAAHADESHALETGRMMASRKNSRGAFARALLAVMGKLIFTPFKPDLLLKDGDALNQYGLDARVIHLPGHTTGHIGILTAGGDLFCGDLLDNGKRPEKFSLVDDDDAMNASIARLKEYTVKTVYPGHGLPFDFKDFDSGRKEVIP